jgi:hypothetical protein
MFSLYKHNHSSMFGAMHYIVSTYTLYTSRTLCCAQRMVPPIITYYPLLEEAILAPKLICIL